MAKEIYHALLDPDYQDVYVVIILIMRHVKLDEKLKGFSHEKMAEKAAE